MTYTVKLTYKGVRTTLGSPNTSREVKFEEMSDAVSFARDSVAELEQLGECRTVGNKMYAIFHDKEGNIVEVTITPQ